MLRCIFRAWVRVLKSLGGQGLCFHIREVISIAIVMSIRATIVIHVRDVVVIVIWHYAVIIDLVLYSLSGQFGLWAGIHSWYFSMIFFSVICCILTLCNSR
ncbi:hypothetical protein CFOL_v3_27228 [Cephalotus follicularis]|uniref:Uncharacterized protein n=1 Tax=Cephalotus follicularis TaxID=3775 RepID=A0A1Q3CUP4_CEPFO|nr:hypothetical protein CFOL_v3_27228 [Cephalotus follicularis]